MDIEIVWEFVICIFWCVICRESKNVSWLRLKYMCVFWKCENRIFISDKDLVFFKYYVNLWVEFIVIERILRKYFIIYNKFKYIWNKNLFGIVIFCLEVVFISMMKIFWRVKGIFFGVFMIYNVVFNLSDFYNLFIWLNI